MFPFRAAGIIIGGLIKREPVACQRLKTGFPPVFFGSLPPPWRIASACWASFSRAKALCKFLWRFAQQVALMPCWASKPSTATPVATNGRPTLQHSTTFAPCRHRWDRSGNTACFSVMPQHRRYAAGNGDPMFTIVGANGPRDRDPPNGILHPAVQHAPRARLL